MMRFIINEYKIVIIIVLATAAISVMSSSLLAKVRIPHLPFYFLCFRYSTNYNNI